jgi:GNAT superfamily N-acetyltransferase
MEEHSKTFNLNKNCVRVSVEQGIQLSEFCCGDDDLDDFFKNDAYLYSKQLLGKTYYFVTIQDPTIVAAFTVANDSIKAALISKSLRNKVQRNIPNSKRTRNYPAILIARLGVSKKMKGKHIGGQVVDYIKTWFSDIENKSGCRFVVVDAYNKPEILKFYESNGFKFLYSSEEEERETFMINPSEHLRSRMMYYDLIYTRKSLNNS